MIEIVIPEVKKEPIQKKAILQRWDTTKEVLKNRGVIIGQTEFCRVEGPEGDGYAYVDFNGLVGTVAVPIEALPEINLVPDLKPQS